MRKIILSAGLVVGLLAAPEAVRADVRGWDHGHIRHHGIERHLPRDHRVGLPHRHRAGPPQAWYYKPGPPSRFVPWPGTPRHKFLAPPHPTLAPVPLHVVLGNLRHHYPSILGATRHRDRYVIVACDRFKRQVRIVVDARTGHIVERRLLRS